MSNLKEKVLFIEALGKLQEISSQALNNISFANIEMSNNDQIKAEEIYEAYKRNLSLLNRIVSDFENKDKYIKEQRG